MHKDFHSVILMYTFVNNKELDKEFLRCFQETFKGAYRINESVYSVNNIDLNFIANKIREIYDKCINQYPSQGGDYVSILYSAKLADIKQGNKDRIVELHIVGTTFKS